MKLQGKTILILPHDNPEQMGNIKIPKSAKNFMLTGDVIDIAPGVKQVQKNEKVFYNKGTRSEITLKGIVYHLVQEEYIVLRYE